MIGRSRYWEAPRKFHGKPDRRKVLPYSRKDHKNGERSKAEKTPTLFLK